MLSNEFVNVWSHFVGFLWCWYMLVWLNVVVFDDPAAEFTGIDRLLMSLYLLCVQARWACEMLGLTRCSSACSRRRCSICCAASRSAHTTGGCGGTSSAL